MWIRSKNRDVLKNCNSVEVDGGNIYASGYLIGEYSSKERALEIVDMVENRIIRGSEHDDISNGRRVKKDFVFRMPEK